MGIPISFSLMDFKRFFLWVLVCKCICTFYFKGKTGINNVKQIKKINKQINKQTNTTFVNLRRVYFSILFCARSFILERSTLDNNMTLFLKVCVFKNFAIFKGKHLCWSLFFDKVASLKPKREKETTTQFFSYEYC